MAGIESILGKLRNKKILLLGFGKEGCSSYAFIRRHLGDVPLGIADLREFDTDGLSNFTAYVGEDYQKAIRRYDIVLRSPGVALERPTPSALAKMSSQTDLFLSGFSTHTIGVTGTKGKSTTASLLYHIFRETGRSVVLAGNIGIPVLDIVPEVKEDTIVVFELSSHQLEYGRFSPRVGILLNIYQEHLDHYGSMEKYAYAKQNIYRNQRGGDILVCNTDFLPTERVNGSVISVSDNHAADCLIVGRKIVCGAEITDFGSVSLPLLGRHNFFNIAVAFVAARMAGVTRKEFFSALGSFAPLPHRLEFVAEIRGVKYYNDSIATICEAAQNAVAAIGNVGSIIIGGMDRGIEYGGFAEFLLRSRIKNIIALPDTGFKVLELMSALDATIGGKRAIPVADMRAAVAAAKKYTKSGTACLLSPAAASYGKFKNFEERGDKFKEEVRA